MQAPREHLLALHGGAVTAGLAHPGYTATAGTALAAALIGWALTALPARKRLTWAVDLDVPVGLAANWSSDAGWKLFFPEHNLQLPDPNPEEIEAGSLVLVTVTNIGLTPVRGGDFRMPLTFQFAGREVCQTTAFSESAGLCAGCQPSMLPALSGDPSRSSAAGGGRPSGVVLGRQLLLPRNGTCRLLAILRGAPSSGLPPVTQGGSLAGGSIVAGGPDGAWCAPPRPSC